MVRHWQLQETKNKFCELVDKAVNQGPQVVISPRRRGRGDHL